MCEAQIHRGPDEEGYLFLRGETEPRLCRGRLSKCGDLHEDYFLGFGHRRLRIIDPATGQQPMCNEDGTVWVISNGEIYNYRELRSHLEAQGHEFFTRSDTEVLVHLYEQEPIDRFLGMLNGIFAMAIWDAKPESVPGVRSRDMAGAVNAPDGQSGRLLLARDRLGVKPLCYSILGPSNTSGGGPSSGTAAGVARRVIFASEMKGILAAPGVPRDVDVEALADHFTFQFSLGDKTLIKNIKTLPAGHYLTVQSNQLDPARSWTGGLQSRSYWNLAYSDGGSLAALSVEAAAGQVREVFEQAVTRQLVSDVPLGSYLSGGMDTGAISAVAARSVHPLHTFTCGFDMSAVTPEEKHFDEMPHSEALSGLLGTTHHELRLKPGDMLPALPEVVWHLDEPVVGISYQVYLVARLVREHVTVVMAGVGGDEFFGGYPWRYRPVMDLTDADGFESAYYRQWVRFMDDDAKRKLFTPRVVKGLRDYSTFEAARAIMRESRGWHPLHRAMHFDAKTFLQGLLMVEDKLGMAHSLESRVPFLDNELVDLAVRLPARLKVSGDDFKIVLKQAMKGLLPDETFTRRKMDFTPPDASWYRMEPAMGYLRELIIGRRALARAYFEPAMLDRIMDDHISGRANNRFLIWSLACFEWWNRLYIDREPLS